MNIDDIIKRIRDASDKEAAIDQLHGWVAQNSDMTQLYLVDNDLGSLGEYAEAVFQALGQLTRACPHFK